MQDAYTYCSQIESNAEEVFFPAFKEYLDRKGFSILKHNSKESQSYGDYTIYNYEYKI